MRITGTSVMLAASAALLTACATPGAPMGATRRPIPASAAAPLPDSVHWYRDSAEQKAIYLETYRAAGASARELSQGLNPGTWGVILDVDETILDNSDYQKQQALRGQGFSQDTWEKWVAARRATLLPGARTFTDTVRELHGEVVLITNRAQSECPATEDNLHAVGLEYDRILCDRTGDQNKNARFREVIAGEPGIAPPLNVLIFVGDNIQDFPTLTQGLPGDFSPFGVRYFALPNPMYGSWQKNPAR